MHSVSMNLSLTTVIAFLMASAGWTTSAMAGTLKVTSFPTGAQVIVDGVGTGKLTPMNISLADGDHIITVQIPDSGWNADTRTVTIVPGNNDLSVTLLPVLAVGPAGPPGPKGDKGDQGAPGVNGSNGLDGVSLVSFGLFSGDDFGCQNGGALFGALTPSGGGLIQTPICNGLDGLDGVDGTSPTRADGPCFDDTNRYVDCGNGTVTDTVTGLIWLKQWNCLPLSTYAAANQAAAGLKDGDCSLTDKSSPGDWRLPTRAEWEATTAQAVMLGCAQGVSRFGGPPSLTNDAGIACYDTGVGSSFAAVAPEFYWSSTTAAFDPTTASFADLVNGTVGGAAAKSGGLRMWPVRSGPR